MSARAEARPPWWMPGAVVLAAGLVRTLGATWRTEVSQLAAWDLEIDGGARCIFAFWHARLLPLVVTHQDRGIVVLVSRHRDGEWIARIVERLGFGTARGSSTRGGEEGMRRLLAAAQDHRNLAITPDGPRGPAERVKPGLVWLASRTGLPVVPVAAAADRAHVFRSWDRFRVPLPFARVRVEYGAPIAVPPDLAPDDTAAWVARLEQAIAGHTREVARRAGEPR